MTRRFLTFACLAVVTLAFVSCGWKPKVTAVPVTAPWDRMDLPIKQNAIVWSCNDKQFKAVHKEDKKTVMGRYVEALRNQGWAITKFDDKAASNYFVDLTKGTEKMQLEVYDFENTGVIIEKK